MQWISDTGIPFINTITYGKSCEETHKCVENFKAMNSKREVYCYYCKCFVVVFMHCPLISPFQLRS